MRNLQTIRKFSREKKKSRNQKTEKNKSKTRTKITIFLRFFRKCFEFFFGAAAKFSQFFRDFFTGNFQN